MTHILFDKDDASGYYIVPVRCERANWKNCPQHKNLKAKADKAPDNIPMFDVESSSNAMSYEEYANADTDSILHGGFTYGELYAHGLTGEDIRELGTVPPKGAEKKNHTWSSSLLSDTRNVDGFIPSFVIAEALLDETEKDNAKRYENLSDDNNVRVQVLQEGGEDYYRLASIVLDDKEGVFNSKAKEAAEKVQLRSNRLGNKGSIGTPLIKHPETGLWEVDPVVSELALHTSLSILNMDSENKKKREHRIFEYQERAIKNQAWDEKGLASDIGLSYQNAAKPTDKLIHYRLKNRILEKELEEFDAQKPAGFFGRGKREKERNNILEVIAANKRELDAAERVEIDYYEHY